MNVFTKREINLADKLCVFPVVQQFIGIKNALLNLKELAIDVSLIAYKTLSLWKLETGNFIKECWEEVLEDDTLYDDKKEINAIETHFSEHLTEVAHGTLCAIPGVGTVYSSWIWYEAVPIHNAEEVSVRREKQKEEGLLEKNYNRLMQCMFPQEEEEDDFVMNMLNPGIEEKEGTESTSQPPLEMYEML